jgi:hypothetical protein
MTSTESVGLDLETEEMLSAFENMGYEFARGRPTEGWRMWTGRREHTDPLISLYGPESCLVYSSLGFSSQSSESARSVFQSTYLQRWLDLVTKHQPEASDWYSDALESLILSKTTNGSAETQYGGSRFSIELYRSDNWWSLGFSAKGRSSSIAIGDDRRIVPHTVERSFPDLNLSIASTLPRIEDPNTPSTQNFNQIAAVIGQEETIDVLEWIDGEPIDYSDGGLNMDYYVTYADGHLVSVYIEMVTYLGGAHPSNQPKVLNYDFQKGRSLTLDALFLNEADHLLVLADYCISVLKERGVFDFPEGAQPLPENYAKWNLMPDGLQITFGEYQVAPYAAGIQYVTIPYSHLSEIVDPDGPIANLVEP